VSQEPAFAAASHRVVRLRSADMGFDLVKAPRRAT
jgi:hypothetical protein